MAVLGGHDDVGAQTNLTARTQIRSGVQHHFVGGAECGENGLPGWRQKPVGSLHLLFPALTAPRPAGSPRGCQVAPRPTESGTLDSRMADCRRVVDGDRDRQVRACWRRSFVRSCGLPKQAAVR